MGFMTVEENYLRMALWLHEVKLDLVLAKADGSPEVARLEKDLNDAEKAVEQWRKNADGVYEYRRRPGCPDEQPPIRLFLTNKLSQWARSEFLIDCIKYNCCEQYMMASKAALFNDSESFKKIMEIDQSKCNFPQWNEYPRQQKSLGREVKGFDKEIWERVAQDVVYRGNYAKFSQNPDFWTFLDLTGEEHLAESNPKDPIWGIGLGRDDPRAKDKTQWQGKNWLGEVLMKVRQQIRRDKQVEKSIAAGANSNFQRYMRKE